MIAIKSTLVLASKSNARRSLLEQAGLDVVCDSADIDERMIEAPLLEAAFNPADIAAVLAEAKASDVSARYGDSYVIGADQTLSLNHEGETHRFHKPETMEDARKQLLFMRGKTHTLHSAVCCVRGGETLFRLVDEAHLTMRNLSPEFVGRYLSAIGEAAFQSVGCYQLEGPGVQLFDKIEGNYFTILGLPMLPLLSFLRDQGVLEK